MTGERWVVLGLASPRAPWFSEVARWSASTAIPLEFVKCVSPDEIRARIRSGRCHSALLVSGGAPGLDRDLVGAVSATGAAAIVVDARGERRWHDLGVAGVLPEGFSREELLSALRAHAQPVAEVVEVAEIASSSPDDEAALRGRLVAVTGVGGAGASVLAMAIAQGFAREPGNAGMVLLADLALHADQCMLHDCREMTPGVQELTEAHRGGRLPAHEIRSLAFAAGGRGYHLLLGLRRHRHWTALRPRAFAAALDGLQRSYRLVVADVDADLEGESATGSLDVEDRNLMARLAVARAVAVVAVGSPGTKGTHTLVRMVHELVDHGIEPGRIIPVLNRSPRSPRRRSESVAALASLLGDRAPGVGNPVIIGERTDLERSLRDGAPLSDSFGRPLVGEVSRRLDRIDARIAPPDESPVPVAAGTLGHWSGEAG